MTKFTELQKILLSTASPRDSESIHPLSEAIADEQRAVKALAALTKRGCPRAILPYRRYGV